MFARPDKHTQTCRHTRTDTPRAAHDVGGGLARPRGISPGCRGSPAGCSSRRPPWPGRRSPGRGTWPCRSSAGRCAEATPRRSRTGVRRHPRLATRGRSIVSSVLCLRCRSHGPEGRYACRPARGRASVQQLETKLAADILSLPCLWVPADCLEAFLSCRAIVIRVDSKLVIATDLCE